jgi:hypothetical protein
MHLTSSRKNALVDSYRSGFARPFAIRSFQATKYEVNRNLWSAYFFLFRS